ncbi:MAG: DUF1456 family protein [Phycisphaeraceae bacterium]|nr:DUF1456 family protein [Phycisphaeraceae bacterium]
MTHNDTLRRLRYALTYDDATIAAIFARGGYPGPAAAVAAFLKPEDEPGYVACDHTAMACFLDGLIIHRRGQKEGAPAPQPNPGVSLTNNDVLKKLRIALDLQDADMLAILKQTGVDLTKHELNAFFRKAGHTHYRTCGDVVLQCFLKGLTARYRVRA